MRALYEEEVKARPSLTTMQKINSLNFYVLFNLGALMCNLTQFLLLPLRFLPFPWAKQTYKDGIRYTKGAFGSLLSSSLSLIYRRSRADASMQLL
jgi:hypothetical protein